MAVSALAALQNLSGRDYLTQKEIHIDLKSGSTPVVISFISARCPCSASHEMELKKLAEEYKEFKFVGIHSNQDETEAEALAHFSDSQFPFPVIRDAKAKIADGLGAMKTPHVFILKPGSEEILFQGGIDDSHTQALAKKHYLREALQALREGKTPENSKVRTLGCAISR